MNQSENNCNNQTIYYSRLHIIAYHSNIPVTLTNQKLLLEIPLMYSANLLY